MFPSQEKDMSFLTGQKLSVTREIDFWMSHDATESHQDEDFLIRSRTVVATFVDEVQRAPEGLRSPKWT